MRLSRTLILGAGGTGGLLIPSLARLLRYHPNAGTGHPITVVDGELCYGFGDVFDPDRCKLYPEGSYFVVPANASHFGYGKTGDAVYQESGVGPSAFNPVKSPAP
jgi:hypothetical protein